MRPQTPSLSLSHYSSRQLSLLLLRSVTNCLPFRPFVCLSYPLCLFVCLLFAYFYCHASFLCPAVISSDAAAAAPCQPIDPAVCFANRTVLSSCQPHDHAHLTSPTTYHTSQSDRQASRRGKQQAGEAVRLLGATPNQVQFHVDFQRSSYGFRSSRSGLRLHVSVFHVLGMLSGKMSVHKYEIY